MKLYRDRLKSKALDTARQSKIETCGPNEEDHARVGQADEKGPAELAPRGASQSGKGDRFYKAAARPKLYFSSDRGIKSLIICHISLAFLIFSFFYPPTRALWDFVDGAVFKLLNGTLEDRPKWQLFWALANHKLADWVEDAIFLLFFGLAIHAAPKGERLRKASQFIFCILFAAAIIFFVNRLLFREHLDIPRPSPTLAISPCVRLSDEIPWMSIKDDATSSFPGDHATTLLLFAASYAFYSGRKLGLWAIAYAIFRALPRLIAGAHWFSDIAVGSGAIVLFFLSWALCTPFHQWAVSGIESFLRLFVRRKESKAV